MCIDLRIVIPEGRKADKYLQRNLSLEEKINISDRIKGLGNARTVDIRNTKINSIILILVNPNYDKVYITRKTK